MNKMIMACHSLTNSTGTGLVISLCLNTNPLINLIPPNFRHLPSCGTLGNKETVVQIIKCTCTVIVLFSLITSEIFQLTHRYMYQFVGEVMTDM